ncbi:hypothetical protein KM043_014121 [Ampulex compressa]|nr:hypothetical protein KM043_014121 [Ampulex compressa]
MKARETRGYTHDFIAEFIQLYRSYPCLWQVRCKGYKDRLYRNRAYDALALKLREANPAADRETVVRKINTLRSAFMREYKKVRTSQRRYKSSLWYYDLLNFVTEQNVEPTVAAIASPSEDNPEDTSMILDRCQEEMSILGDAIKIEQQSVTGFQPVILETKGSCGARLSNFQSNEATKPRSDDFHDVHAKMACSAVENPQGQKAVYSIDDDDFETFGRYVAVKLRKSTPRQSIVAEKMIADILLRANLGTLDEDSCLMDVVPPQSIFNDERSMGLHY